MVKVKDLDEMFGTAARVAIVATLARRQRLTFTALRDETGLADGNLHVQTRKLADAGYLSRDRTRRGNRNVTCFELTARGRLRFNDYVRRLQQAAAGTFGQGRPQGAETELSPRGDRSRVW